jgi:hypothetical protein
LFLSKRFIPVLLCGSSYIHSPTSLFPFSVFLLRPLHMINQTPLSPATLSLFIASPLHLLKSDSLIRPCVIYLNLHGGCWLFSQSWRVKDEVAISFKSLSPHWVLMLQSLLIYHCFSWLIFLYHCDVYNV